MVFRIEKFIERWFPIVGIGTAFLIVGAVVWAESAMSDLERQRMMYERSFAGWQQTKDPAAQQVALNDLKSLLSTYQTNVGAFGSGDLQSRIWGVEQGAAEIQMLKQAYAQIYVDTTERYIQEMRSLLSDATTVALIADEGKQLVDAQTEIERIAKEFQPVADQIRQDGQLSYASKENLRFVRDGLAGAHNRLLATRGLGSVFRDMRAPAAVWQEPKEFGATLDQLEQMRQQFAEEQRLEIEREEVERLRFEAEEEQRRAEEQRKWEEEEQRRRRESKPFSGTHGGSGYGTATESR